MATERTLQDEEEEEERSGVWVLYCDVRLAGQGRNFCCARDVLFAKASSIRLLVRASHSTEGVLLHGQLGLGAVEYSAFVKF